MKEVDSTKRPWSTGRIHDGHPYLLGTVSYRTLYGARQACRHFGLPLHFIWRDGRRVYTAPRWYLRESGRCGGRK